MKLFNDTVVDAAQSTVDQLIEAALSAGEKQAVVGIAPAGAGKSYAVCTAVERARKAGLRVAVATPTNDQAFALVASIADRLPRETVTFLHATTVHLPTEYFRKNVEERAAKDVGKAALVVGTLSKLGDANGRGSLQNFDLLLVDEAYQANAVHYFGVGDLAEKHLLMGDSGQLAPFSTAPGADRWRGLDDDPLLTAVDVLLRHHPGTPRFQLPISRRLDPRAVPIAQAFYPGHPFDAAVLPGVRELALAPGHSRGESVVVDKALDLAVGSGWAHVELPSSAVVSADPDTVELILRVVQRLRERAATVRCENQRKAAPLGDDQIAIAVSHNDQKAAVRVALDRANLPDLRVDTANKLQGLTFEVVIAWHPLAGLLETDEFHVDPGRLCVMLTRHRQACIVVGRAGDRELVKGIPPATPSYVGWDSNPALEGWYVHEAVFAGLEDVRVEA